MQAFALGDQVGCPADALAPGGGGGWGWAERPELQARVVAGEYEIEKRMGVEEREEYSIVW